MARVVHGAFVTLALVAAACDCGAPVGVECESDGDCSLNARCDPAFGICVTRRDADEGFAPQDGGLHDAGPAADAGPVDAGPAPDAGAPTVRITSPGSGMVFGPGTIEVLVAAPAPEVGSSVLVRARQSGVLALTVFAAAQGGGEYRASLDSTSPAIVTGEVELRATWQSGTVSFDSAPVNIRVDKTPPVVAVEVVAPDRTSLSDPALASLKSYLTGRIRRVEDVVVRAAIADSVAGVDPASVRLLAPGRVPSAPDAASGGVFSWRFPAASLDMSGHADAALRITVEARDQVGNAGTGSADARVTRVRWWFESGGAIQGAALLARGDDGALWVYAPSDNAIVALREGPGAIPVLRWRTFTSSGRSFRTSPPLAELAPSLGEEAIYAPDFVLGGHSRVHVIDRMTGAFVRDHRGNSIARDLHGAATSVALGMFQSGGAPGAGRRRIYVGDSGPVFEPGCAGCGHMHALEASFGSAGAALVEATTDSTRSHPGGISGPASVSMLSNVFYTGRRVTTNPLDQKWLLVARNADLAPAANEGVISDALVAAITSSPAMISRSVSRIFVGTNTSAVAALRADAVVLNWCGNSSSGAIKDCGVSATVLGSPIIGPPVPNVAGGFRVFFVAGDNSVYGRVATDEGFTSNGWRQALGSAGAPNRTTPALGAMFGRPEGVLYVTTPTGHLHALDGASGAVLWSFPESGAPAPAPSASPSYASPALWCDGTVVWGANDQRLYALTTDSPGLAAAPWPKYRHDNKNSGNLGFPVEGTGGDCP